MRATTAGVSAMVSEHMIVAYCSAKSCNISSTCSMIYLHTILVYYILYYICILYLYTIFDLQLYYICILYLVLHLCTKSHRELTLNPQLCAPDLILTVVMVAKSGAG